MHVSIVNRILRSHQVYLHTSITEFSLYLQTNWYIDAVKNSPETVEKELRLQIPHTPLKTLRGKVPQRSPRNQSVTDITWDDVNWISHLIWVPGATKNQKLLQII